MPKLRKRGARRKLKIVFDTGEDDSEVAGTRREANSVGKKVQSKAGNNKSNTPLPDMEVVSVGIKEPDQGTLTLIIYALVRYYIRRSLTVTDKNIDEAKFLRKLCEKFRELRIACGDRNVCEMMSQTFSSLESRATIAQPIDALEDALEEVSLSAAVKAYTQRRRGVGDRGAHVSLKHVGKKNKGVGKTARPKKISFE